LDAIPGNIPIVRSVLHPTDLSPASVPAFEHALGIALLRQTSLTLLHVGELDSGESFPSVRELLERWELLEPGAPRSAVYDEFKVRIKKKVVRGRPLPAILEYSEQAETDLVVLATRGEAGPSRWLRPSVSEPMAHRTATATLFVPASGRGVIDSSSGRLTARDVLVPVAESPDAQNAVTLAARTAIAANQAHGEEVRLHAMHVGDDFPGLDFPEHEGIRWERRLGKGEVVEAILSVAHEVSADLVVMASDGRNGILDALRGSHSEQVVKRAPCPLLVVPITAHETPILLA
jgi:nucleotide-binding universal stress UspA family protein